MRATPVMIISSTSGIITATIIGGSQQQLIVGLPLLTIVKNLRPTSGPCYDRGICARRGRDIDAT